MLEQVFTRGGTAIGTQSYSYDAFDNRSLAGNSLSFSSTNNRITAAAYDAAGNLTHFKFPGQPAMDWTAAYDGENKQRWFCADESSTCTSVNADAEYRYDAAGNRVAKLTAGETITYVYDAFGKVAAEYSTTAPTGSGGTFYRTTDHLGSTRLVTDHLIGDEATSADDVVARRDFFPFGEEIPANATFNRQAVAGYNQASAFTQQFTAKERDDESGLDYFLARYYAGSLGRFTGADNPFVDQYESDPQSWNLYGYVRNNPLRFVDPTGQACVVRSDGSEFDDESGGQSCADVRKENEKLEPSATVTGEPGNVTAALALNTFFALDNAANDYFRFLTGAIGVQPSYMQNTSTNEGVTGNVAAAGVFVGTTLNPRGLLTNARTRLLQSAQNPKLRNIIGNLYRPGATVGTGSTADAIRSELATGVLLSPKGHFQKGVESRTALQRLNRDPSLGAADRQIVKELLIDLQSALSGR